MYPVRKIGRWPHHHKVSARGRAFVDVSEEVCMLVFIDTEFTGLDPNKPDLISIGLVDETGCEFYAELPPSHHAVQCNEWVHFNVLPHLWGDEYVQSVPNLRDRLTTWLGGRADYVVIVTDCPDADFRFLQWLLPQLPSNVAPAPMLFTAWSMGDDAQPGLLAHMKTYYTSERRAHHALHDANSLRIGMLYARARGWDDGEGQHLGSMDAPAVHPTIKERCAALGLSIDRVKCLAGEDHTLRHLAFMLALDPDTLAPVKPKRWLWMAAKTCSVSYRDELTPDRLQTALVSGNVDLGDEATEIRRRSKAVCPYPRSGAMSIKWPQNVPVCFCARWLRRSSSLRHC